MTTSLLLTGAVNSPPLSPPPSHMSSSPALSTVMGNSLGAAPQSLSSTHSPPPSSPLTPTNRIESSIGGLGSGGSGTNSSGTGLASLHHALHGLHNLHSLQNLQNQMAALAGLQGSTALGLIPQPSPTAPPPPPPQHASVNNLLHPHLNQASE